MIPTWVQQFAPGTASPVNWILFTNFWRDTGSWIDSQVWKD